MVPLRQMWIDLRTSFWFAPLLIVLAAIGLALLMVQYDFPVPQPFKQRWPRVFAIEADAARDLLSTIATSMLSVTGVTFSVTLVALSLTSSQFSTRILRMFMRSGMTHAALGVLSGVFAYCLVVLYAIRGSEGAAGVPALAVLGAFLLAIIGVGLLILFIHHIASSIQVVNIVSSLSAESLATIDLMYPQRRVATARAGHASDAHAGPAPDPGPDADGGVALGVEAAMALLQGPWQVVPADVSGYVETADIEEFLRCARKCGRVVRMEVGIGDFVVEGTPLLSVNGRDALPPGISTALREAYTISQYRTAEQDPQFGIREIVDVALKALSASMNDTTTALTCIDYLSVILARLAPRHLTDSARSEQGQLRLIACGPGFGAFVSGAFDEIRESAGGNAVVLSRILRAIEVIARLTLEPTRLRVLREQIERIEEQAARKLESPAARERLAIAMAAARVACGDDRP